MQQTSLFDLFDNMQTPQQDAGMRLKKELAEVETRIKTSRQRLLKAEKDLSNFLNEVISLKNELQSEAFPYIANFEAAHLACSKEIKKMPAQFQKLLIENYTNKSEPFFNTIKLLFGSIQNNHSHTFSSFEPKPSIEELKFMKNLHEEIDAYFDLSKIKNESEQKKYEAVLNKSSLAFKSLNSNGLIELRDSFVPFTLNKSTTDEYLKKLLDRREIELKQIDFQSDRKITCLKNAKDSVLGNMIASCKTALEAGEETKGLVFNEINDAYIKLLAVREELVNYIQQRKLGSHLTSLMPNMPEPTQKPNDWDALRKSFKYLEPGDIEKLLIITQKFSSQSTDIQESKSSKKQKNKKSKSLRKNKTIKS